jgi:hypothetical protein
VEMVAEAIASGIQAKHLLFDSWFAYPATMRPLHDSAGYDFERS